MSRTKVLLPFNFTGYDRKSMDFVALTFAPLKDHEVTLLHAYAPVPGIDGSSGYIMEKLKGNLSYLSQKLKEKELGLKAERKNLIENGFAEDRVIMLVFFCRGCSQWCSAIQDDRQFLSDGNHIQNELSIFSDYEVLCWFGYIQKTTIPGQDDEPFDH